MSEVPKRLAPTQETIRRLFSLSGNLCYFRGCHNIMINSSGDFIAQICHIEAAMPGGERFNENMSNEQRRSFDNLILLCYEHHVTTNDVEIYDVKSLKDMKHNHESIFAEDLVVNKMLLSLKDYTRDNSFKEVSNLKNLFIIIWGENYDVGQDELDDAIKSFNSSIRKYLNLTPFSRKVFACGIARSNHPVNIYRIDNESLYVDFHEICKAFGRPTNDVDVWSSVDEIVAKNLMILTEVNINEYAEVNRHVYSNCLDSSEYDINIWLWLKIYCEKSGIDIRDYLEEFNFDSLDS
ncbi:hypothetical protein ACIPUG_13080 [Pectobacterium sp. CHL-2024]|uniref:hypothetical protein n=1 Tax=Pectobacterium sp. CHL-2024 TaxID=3377079 RepID=UPI00380B7FF0